MILELRAGQTIFAPALALEAWADLAKIGERAVYALGNIIKDCSMGSLDSVSLNSTARVAMRLSDMNKVHLFQRKMGEELYEYIIIKRDPHQVRQSRIRPRRPSPRRQGPQTISSHQSSQGGLGGDGSCLLREDGEATEHKEQR